MPNMVLHKEHPGLTKRQQLTLRARAMSQAAQLINQLAANALGELTAPMPQEDGTVKHVPHLLDMAQVRSAEIVLKKAVPDLTQTDLELTDDTRRRTPQEAIEQLVDMLTTHPQIQEAVMKRLSGRDDEVVVEPGEAEEGES